jgi:hypothetical protein
MDLGQLIRDRIREALERSGADKAGQSNVAISANVGGSGQSTTVYSDDDVTIIDRDGERQVIRHRPRDEPDVEGD